MIGGIEIWGRNSVTVQMLLDKTTDRDIINHIEGYINKLETVSGDNWSRFPDPVTEEKYDKYVTDIDSEVAKYNKLINYINDSSSEPRLVTKAKRETFRIHGDPWVDSISQKMRDINDVIEDMPAPDTVSEPDSAVSWSESSDSRSSGSNASRQGSLKNKIKYKKLTKKGKEWVKAASKDMKQRTQRTPSVKQKIKRKERFTIKKKSQRKKSQRKKNQRKKSQRKKNQRKKSQRKKSNSD